MSQPPLGYVTGCRVVDAYDGDTVVVDITRRVRVRLLDCWAPEIRTHDSDEKRRGIASRAYLASILEAAGNVVLQVPTQDDDVQDWMSLGRVLGHLWVDGETVSSRMVAAGHATKEKS